MLLLFETRPLKADFALFNTRIKIRGGMGEIFESLFRQTIYVPVTCFRSLTCCFVVKANRIKDDYGVENRSQISRFD